jgi:hypothetical protein
MANIQTRLKNIEENMGSVEGDINIMSLLKIENWKYEIGSKDMITLQEWDKYKQRTLRNSLDKEKDEKELNELEKKIRDEGGFMEIEFIDMEGNIIEAK